MEICWIDKAKRQGVIPLCDEEGINVARILFAIDGDDYNFRLDFRPSERGRTWGWLEQPTTKDLYLSAFGSRELAVEIRSALDLIEKEVEVS